MEHRAQGPVGGSDMLFGVHHALGHLAKSEITSRDMIKMEQNK